MKNNKKLCSAALSLAVLILFLTLVSSAASATAGQSASHAGTYAYITNYDNNVVYVIDTATDTATATVNVGTGPTGVAVTPDRTKVYVTNWHDNTVSVIDAATNTVTATVSVEEWPEGVAVNPDGTMVYVANSGNGTVSVIDTATNKVTATVPVGKYPCGVTVSPYEKKVYVTNKGSNTVSVIDTATNKVTDTVKVGTQPYGVAISPAGTRVYVTNYWSNTVSVINTATNTVIATIEVGFLPHGVAVSPDGKSVYVANTGSGNKPGNAVSIIDTVTNTVKDAIYSEGYPYGVAVNPEGTKVYVTGTSRYVDVSFYVFDIATHTIKNVNVGSNTYGFGQFIAPPPLSPVANFTSNVTNGYAPLTVKFTDISKKATSWNWNFGDGTSSTEQNPVHIFSAAGNYIVNLTVSNTNGTSFKLAMINVAQKNFPPTQYAYIANWGSNTVSVINTATNKVIATVPVGFEPIGVAVSPDGKKAYVTEVNAVSVIDTATNKVTATVDIDGDPYGVAVSPDGTKVYVTNTWDNTVSIISAATNTITTTVDVGNRPYGIAVSPDGKKVYVTNSNDDTVSVIDAATNTVIATVKVGHKPYGVAVTPDGTKVYVVDQNSNAVSVIDTATNTVTVTIPVEQYPRGVAVSPVGIAYVTSTLSSAVSIIDTTTNTVTDTVYLGGGYSPYGVAVTPDGTKVYVANQDKNSVSVINTATNKVIDTVPIGNYPYSLGNFIGFFQAQLPILPVANFTSNVTSGYVPLSVKFNDSSLNATSWKWNFGDGNSSTDQNPTHTYSAIGNYTVNLTVSNANGTSSKLAIITVLVKPGPVIPVANFTSNVTSGSAPLTVKFTDLSKNATSWNWDFGDRTNSTQKNPTHTYSAAGNYIVNLTVSNANGKNSKLAIINVLDKTVSKAQYAYVANNGDGTVSIINTATNNVTSTVDVGGDPYGVAVSPDGKKVYVTHINSGIVSVIDTATSTATSTVNIGGMPVGVAVIPDGTKAYVTNWGSETVSVIDTATNTLASTINVGSYPLGVAVSQDGKKIYVTNEGSNTVSVIDTATNTLASTVNVGSYPYGVAVSPDGTKIYVANSGSNTVSVIDTATSTVIATTNVGSNPYGVAVSPDGTKVYVTNIYSDTVSVIDTATNNVTSTIYVRAYPLGVAVTSDGTKAYVTNWGSETVSVIDTATNIVTATVEVGYKPSALGKFIGNVPVLKPVLPVANFTSNVTSGYVPLSVKFNDSSLNATSWKWNFGDGTNSTQRNTTHVYSVPGNYIVNLTVSNVNGTSSKLGNITALNKTTKVLPVANFTSNVTSGYVPLSVQFNDSSLNATSWKWNFGDGTNSTQRNTTHVYSKAGNYTVNLTVSNVNGTSSKLAIITVLVKPGPVLPVANFSSNVTNGSVPLSVQFIDLSKNTTSWNWNFGDGTSSAQQNPMHTFSAAGNYIVNLTVSNANGTNSKLATITVVQKASPGTFCAYITSPADATVFVIDTTTNTVTAKVPVEGNPYGVAVSPAGKVYVAEEFSDTVTVIDVATNMVTATVNVGKTPEAVAVNPAGTKIYVGNRADKTVSVIDASTNMVTASVPVGNDPSGVSVNPDGTKVYVANREDNTVSVIDTATNKVTATVPVGPGPNGIAVNPAGTKVYVANNGNDDEPGNTVSVIDTATNKITATVPVGNYPFGVAVTPDGKKVYVTGFTVSVIDTATNSVTDNVSVGGIFSFGIAVLPVQKPVLTVANFTSNVTSGIAPLTVAFTDKSTGAPTAWNWIFGDGTNSTQQNTTHQYSKVGNYTVSLTVSNAAGNNTTTKTNYIKVTATTTKPVANFTSNVTSGKVPLNVAFTDKSTGTPAKWKWTFGDGTNSTTQNPTHNYSKTGNYTVALTVSNAAGNNTTTKTNYIKVTATTTRPVANFTSNVTSGNTPLTVAFTDKSTGLPTAWKWTFGDGTNSTVKNPTHKYSKAGNYTVALTSTNAAGSNTTTKTNYIKVKAVTKPIAAFSGSPTSGNVPLNVSFADKSTGTPTAWKWTFGDGTNSTVKNPTHKYSKVGNYTVALTSTNAAGSNTTTKTNYIKVSSA